MFSILRKAIVLTLTAVGGIVLWNAFDLPGRVGLSRPVVSAEPQVSSQETQAEQPPDRSTASGYRLIIWAAFVLLLPVVTAPLASRVIGKESNTANLLLLSGYTGLDVIAAYVVLGVHVGGILSAILHLIALLGAFAYNLWICGMLARLQNR